MIATKNNKREIATLVAAGKNFWKGCDVVVIPTVLYFLFLIDNSKISRSGNTPYRFIKNALGK
jgi:hypothetical protein